MANLKANDIALGTWVKHKRTKTLAKVWNVDPSLGKFQLEDPYGNKDKMWRSAKDWTLTKAPKQAKPAKYKLGAKYSSTFDYDGMLKMALKATYSWGKDKLRKLFDSFEDVNYHTASKNLWNAIQSYDDKAEAEKYLKLFHKDVKTEMLSENKDKKMNEMENRNLYIPGWGELQPLRKFGKSGKIYILEKNPKLGVLTLDYSEFHVAEISKTDSWIIDTSKKYKSIYDAGVALSKLIKSGYKNKYVKESKMNEAKELSPLQKAYSEFFFSMLAAYEVDSPAQLSDEKKKEFFSQVKTDWAKKKVQLAKQGIKPKFKKDDVVYNKRTKTIGIVRLPDDKYGEVKTDADGNVDVDEVEYYNPMKNTKHKSAKVAPSTKKEIEKRHLWKPFSPRNEGSVRRAKTKSGKNTDDLDVDYNGKTYRVAWSADSSGFKGTPYGISFPGDEHYTFLSKSKKAKDLWKKLKPLVDKEVLRIYENYKHLNEGETEFEAFYNGKKVIVKSSKGIWDAKQKAFKLLKVPKSKQGLVAIQSMQSKKNQDFRFNEAKVRRIIRKEIQKIFEARKLNEGFDEGTKVWIEPIAPAQLKSYPAGKWVKKKMKVELIDYAPNDGTLDVLDVKLPNGKEESIYDFQIVKKA